MPESHVLTRFAPSLTGHLHIGHVAHLLWVFAAARASGADVLLRIEDHDRSRARPEYEDSIRADVDWLGFRFDQDVGRQSDDEAPYLAALDRLQRTTRVYGCDCSRKQIAAHSPLDHNGERIYSGRCRERGLPPEPPYAVRVELPGDPIGDIVVRDRSGQWTYQLAVVVDDLRQGVDLIVRGEDLEASTSRQITLGRLLGRERPARFLHHPLLLDAQGQKLSKRSGAAAIAERRHSGEPAAHLLGEALETTPLSLEEALKACTARLPW